MLVFGTDSSQSAGTHTGILQGTEVQLSRCVPKAEVPAGRSRAGSQPRSAAGGQSPACTWDSCTMCALQSRGEAGEEAGLAALDLFQVNSRSPHILCLLYM